MRGFGTRERAPVMLTVPETIPVKRRVLVLGAGLSAAMMARRLVEAGLEVVLVRRGQAAEEDYLEEHPGVELLSGARLVALEGDFGDFKAFVETEVGPSVRRLEREIGAVVVAVGLRREQPRQLPTAMRLADFPPLAGAGEAPRRVCFLMDLEQSTPLAEFQLALEAALNAAREGASVYFLCREVKVAGEGLERLYTAAREAGVLFIKYQAPPEVAPVGEAASLQVMDESPGVVSHLSRLRLTADAIVMPDVLLPAVDNAALADLLRTDLDGEGYFQPANVRLALGRTNRRGVFVVGGCRAPCTVTEAYQEAAVAAEEIASLLEQGEARVDWPVAVVDPEKCAYCLTCNRICPHRAAGMNPEDECAIVYASACYGCGLCVAECPSAAIAMEKYTDSDLVASFKTLGPS